MQLEAHNAGQALGAVRDFLRMGHLQDCVIFCQDHNTTRFSFLFIAWFLLGIRKRNGTNFITKGISLNILVLAVSMTANVYVVM